MGKVFVISLFYLNILVKEIIGKWWEVSIPTIQKVDWKKSISYRRGDRKLSSQGHLRTILDDELSKMFKNLKEHYGLKNNSEMLRFLIKKEHDMLRKTGKI